MQDTVWEDMTLRFPHLARKIFGKSRDKDFARCNEVCRTWKYFYDNEKRFQNRLKGRMPLHWAADEGRFQACKRILEVSKGIMKNPQDKYGVTPLHLAAQNGNFPIYELILENLGDWYHAKNPSDLCGTTPLHLAAKNGHLFLCKTILQSDWCRQDQLKNLWHFENSSFQGEVKVAAQRDF